MCSHQAQISVAKIAVFGYDGLVKIPLQNWRRFAEGGPAGRWHSIERRGGFSLLEMLIVLALILIMSVMLYGSGSRSYQQKQKLACQKNLLNLHIALQLFANDHEGSFPVAPGARTAEDPLALLVPRYTVDTRSFTCPGSKDSPIPPGGSFSRHKISYAYMMGRRSADAQELLMTDKQVNTDPKGPGQLLFSSNGKPPGNNHHKFGGNYLFVDGHVEMGSATASFPIAWPQGVELLNPKP